MADEKTTSTAMENQPGIAPVAAPVAALQAYYNQLDVMSAEEYAAKEKKLVQKIDLRLMPLLFLMIVMK